MKYFVLKFNERNGDFEYTHYHLYSQKDLENLKFQGDDDDHIVLSDFFCDHIDKSNDWGDGYWTSDGLRVVSYQGMTPVKKSELKTLEKVGIY